MKARSRSGLFLVGVAALCLGAAGDSAPPTLALPHKGGGDSGGAQQDAAKAEQAVKEQVRRLLAQLDSAKREQREEAQKALEELGPEVLPLLPEPGEGQSVEFRRRVLAVRRALHARRAEQFGQATRVTIQGEGLSLEEVLEQLAAQTGNAVVDYRDQFGQELGEVELDLDLEKASFWEAMDAIVRETGLNLYLETEGGEIGLIQGGMNRDSPHRRDFGPVRFTPRELVLRQDLLGTGMGSCTLTVDLMWEPRLRPLYLKHTMAEVRAFDENGEALEISDEEAEYETTPPGRRAGTELTITLKPPPRGVKRIAKLEGKLLVAAPAEMETFRFEDPSRVRGKELSRGAVSVTLQGFRKDDFRWHARFLVRYDEAGGGAFESYRTGAWLMRNDLYLEDEEGTRIDFEEYNGGINFGGVDEGTFDITYIFVDVPGEITEYTLYYRSPGTILELPVEYEFRDLPLP